MKITCPACGFSREVARDRLPANSVLATCPKCGEKFKIKLLPGDAAAQGEEEDIRLTASRAYQAEAERFAQEKERDPADGMERQKSANPWDQAPEPSGWAQAFFQTLSRVMFSPARFFSSLAPVASPLRPLLFYALIILLQTVMDQLWVRFFASTLQPAASGDPQLAKLLELVSTNGNVVLSSLLRLGLMIFQLYIFTLILFFTYRILAPKKAAFDLLFQLMTYSSAPAILCVVPILGTLIGMVWSVGCFVIGVKSALDLDWAKTLLGLLPVIFLLSPLLSLLLNMF